MRLRFLARLWRAGRSQPPRRGGSALPSADGVPARFPPLAPPAGPPPTSAPGGGRHRRGERGGRVAGDGRTPGATPIGSPGPAGGRAVTGGDGAASPMPSRDRSHTLDGGGQPSGAAGRRASGRPAGDRAAARIRTREPSAAPGKGPTGEAACVPAARAAGGPAAGTAGLPWYEVAHARSVAQGLTDCGPLEAVLVREWPAESAPPPGAARAVTRLADLPVPVQRRLAEGIDAIHIGAGGVPDLDDMGALRGVPLPSGRATWDACAGAYGERKIIVGTRPSAAPDVMCHEVGHALDDLDGRDGGWQSDEDDFRSLYERCLGKLVSDFHRQAGSLGRREFFADSFAAIASSQRPALLDMLGGDIRSALEVMLYFNLRYGI